jgi:methionyl aminopeptidase
MMVWYRNINLKTPEEIEIMQTAGRINAEALAAAYDIIRPGVTTADLNAAAEEVLKKYGVTSPFYHYPGPYPYPASTTICINEELVHAIPGPRKLKSGDIVSIDCGTNYKGYIGDSAFTAGVGEISPEAQRLVKITEQALYIGIEQMVAGNRVGDVSAAIQGYVEKQNLHVTREYTGHGVGRRMHEGPQVPNYGVAGRGLELREGMVIALEPMVLVGTHRTTLMPDDWTVVSEDGSLTCHWEHTVAITAQGPRILTKLGNGASPAQIAGQLNYELV